MCVMAVRLVRFWFTFEQPVGRVAYLKHGAALMVVKYVGDLGIVAAAGGGFWTPANYLWSVPFLLAKQSVSASPYMAPLLAVWTLPFLWIGIGMTLRRTLDAGRSAWLSLLFFVPYANYLLMFVLCLLPSAPLSAYGLVRARPADHRLPSALLSMAVGGALGLGMLAFSTLFFDSYGIALFMGTPFAIGALTAFLFCRRYPASVRETIEVSLMTLFVTSGAAFLVGFEGVVCLLMALPLAIVLGLMGAVVGRVVARSPTRAAHAALAMLVVPATAVVEQRAAGPSLREVRSAIEVRASAARVWESVVAFPALPDPTELPFRLGIAFPVRAEIIGEGVAALRYCVFSTGSFVEPITRWEPGRRLSFDVVVSPPPLEEWTFYERVRPPHLEGYLAPARGEFRIVELPNGTTRLEGSTWYEQRLRPEGYWVVFSDYLIKRIHLRVLRHIRRQAERNWAQSRRPVSVILPN